MEVLLVLVPFVVVGLVVIFVAFSGGAAAAREAYLSRGGRFFSFSMVLLYLALGVAVPAAVIAARGEAEGGVGSLRSEQISGKEEEGKTLFIQTCKSCHTLEAVQAHGVTGPEPRRARRARQGARAPGDQARRHRLRPDAPAAARRRPTPTPWPPTWPTSPVAERAGSSGGPFATPVAFSPQAPGFSVRRICSGASMAASSKPKLRGESRSVGDPGGRLARGESQARVAHLFQREPVS